VAEKLNVLNSQHESLQKELKYQSDYLTTAEIQARAPKKKIRKRKKIETDEKDDVTVKIDPKVKKQLADMEEVNSDEEDAWLYEQLSRQRRLQRKDEVESGVKKEMGAASLLEVVEKKELKEAEVQLQPTANEGTKANPDAQLTGTTQFTKAVQTAAEKLESRRHESYTGALQFKQQQLQRQRRGARAGLAKKKDDDEDEEQTKQEQEETRENLSEKVLDGTAASAIAYLRSRNEIQKDQDNHRAKEKDLQPLEMGTEKNAIRLETRDEFGRVMTPKQAFQQLSWVFHGKRPGAKNEMKRLLRLENELKMRATDVEKSLPTMRALRKVQGGEAKAHIVLTSGNA